MVPLIHHDYDYDYSVHASSGYEYTPAENIHISTSGKPFAILQLSSPKEELVEEQIVDEPVIESPLRVLAPAPMPTKQYDRSKFNDKDFRHTYYRTNDVDYYRELVVDNKQMGAVLITRHEGGSDLERDKLLATAEHVISSMSNIPYDENVVYLVMETFMVETHMGSYGYAKSAKVNNFGIGQIRPDTARDTLDWLSMLRRDVYEDVMAYYDDSMSLEDNLLVNVPFSIAMCTQIYWRKVPDLGANSSDLVRRAMAWKSAYNSPLGAGTVNVYLAKAGMI